MLNFEYSENSALNDKVFEIICRVFKTTKDSILDKFDRDGVRVYASGSLFKLLLDTCGYSVKEVMLLTGKPRSIISRHKNIISNLDHKHIFDKKIIKKFIESKKQLIKYILNEYKQETNDEAEEVEFEEVGSFDANPDFSPFDEPVKERDYTKPNIDASQIEGELEEPTFEAPSFSDFEEEEEPKPFNPSYNELGNKEKQMGAEMIADVVVDGYARLKKGMGSLSTISENKLEENLLKEISTLIYNYL